MDQIEAAALQQWIYGQILQKLDLLESGGRQSIGGARSTSCKRNVTLIGCGGLTCC
jgi:hypothetical protein